MIFTVYFWCCIEYLLHVFEQLLGVGDVAVNKGELLIDALQNKIGIVGYGQIGQALYDIYQDNNYNVKVFDPAKNFNEDISNCDILLLTVCLHDF